MPHGHPDYGPASPVSTVYSVQDMAELAARLGSIVTFDRRGNVVFMDDFAGGLAKLGDTDIGGAQGVIDISNAHAYHGAFSCRIVAHPETGSSMTYYLPYPILSRMGFEFSWLREDQYLEWVFLHIRLMDGTNSWDAQVYWNATNLTWYVYDGVLGDFRALSPTVDYDIAMPAFNHTKLVIDYVTKKYVRLLVNEIVFDLAGTSLQTFGEDENAKIWCTIENESDGPQASTIYLDRVIITQNEP